MDACFLKEAPGMCLSVCGGQLESGFHFHFPPGFQCLSPVPSSPGCQYANEVNNSPHLTPIFRMAKKSKNTSHYPLGTMETRANQDREKMVRHWEGKEREIKKEVTERGREGGA